MNIVDIVSFPSGQVLAANFDSQMYHHEIVISGNSSLSLVPLVDDFEQAPPFSALPLSHMLWSTLSKWPGPSSSFFIKQVATLALPVISQKPSLRGCASNKLIARRLTTWSLHLVATRERLTAMLLSKTKVALSNRIGCILYRHCNTSRERSVVARELGS